MRVLIVDDEPFIIWLKLQLEQNGIETVWARGFDEAAKIILNDEFDAAIVDIRMVGAPESARPEDDAKVRGLELYDRILARQWARRDNVILYSVYSEHEFEETAAKVGFDTQQVVFFSKRNPGSSLVSYIHELLQTG